MKQISAAIECGSYRETKLLEVWLIKNGQKVIKIYRFIAAVSQKVESSRNQLVVAVIFRKMKQVMTTQHTGCVVETDKVPTVKLTLYTY